jgi:hypothetical protein
MTFHRFRGNSLTRASILSEDSSGLSHLEEIHHTVQTQTRSIHSFLSVLNSGNFFTKSERFTQKPQSQIQYARSDDQQKSSTTNATFNGFSRSLWRSISPVRGRGRAAVGGSRLWGISRLWRVARRRSVSRSWLGRGCSVSRSRLGRGCSESWLGRVAGWGSISRLRRRSAISRLRVALWWWVAWSWCAVRWSESRRRRGAESRRCAAIAAWRHAGLDVSLRASGSLADGLQFAGILADGALKTESIDTAISAVVGPERAPELANVGARPDRRRLHAAVTTAALIATGTGPVLSGGDQGPAAEANRAHNAWVGTTIAEGVRVPSHLKRLERLPVIEN